ncbi:MAG TPA: DNA-directed RNA polymerase subunit omega [Limnochordia bacterium]|nr:DNA-directed RNA polymerase subunit omega [Limnochordia bacterium]
MKPTRANRYEAIMVVSQRARQLIDGAEPVMETKATKPVTIAIEELEAGKIQWEYKQTQ